MIRQGGGRMASFPNLSSPDATALAQLCPDGDNKELASAGTGADPRINQTYRFSGYHKWLDPDGYPGHRAAVGHFECDQSQHRRIRLENSVW